MNILEHIVIYRDYVLPLLVQIWLSNLELLAMILAATIHDVDHPGTTNSFQTKTMLVIYYAYWCSWLEIMVGKVVVWKSIYTKTA